ncbi:progranulin-like [Tachypleus tridentatus]|uniref:progranulin-like n=1 Tax=Tachypleus tridentatus TaxID=6853 RepID=UPI003FD6A9A3
MKMVLKVSVLLMVVVVTRASLYCGAGEYCSSGKTCCWRPNGHLGCCPYEYANCCGGASFCCGPGSSCDLENKRCYSRDSKSSPAVPVIFKS